jgi:hypothetical protein
MLLVWGDSVVNYVNCWSQKQKIICTRHYHSILWIDKQMMEWCLNTVQFILIIYIQGNMILSTLESINWNFNLKFSLFFVVDMLILLFCVSLFFLYLISADWTNTLVGEQNSSYCCATGRSLNVILSQFYQSQIFTVCFCVVCLNIMLSCLSWSSKCWDEVFPLKISFLLSWPHTQPIIYFLSHWAESVFDTIPNSSCSVV